MAKKKAKKRTSKRKVSKAPTKAVRKQLKTLRTRSTNAIKARKKMGVALARSAKDQKKINAELLKLKSDLSRVKGKKSKKQLNEYNLFMRRQLLKGKTFNQAVKLWKRLRNVEAGKIPTKTRIKTVVQKVRVKSKPKVIVKTRRIKSKPKIITRRIKSKPKIIIRTRKIKAKSVLEPTSKPKRKSKKKIKRKSAPKPRVKTRTRTIVKTKTVVRKSEPIIKYRTRTKIVEKPGVKSTDVSHAALAELAERVARETVERIEATHPKQPPVALDKLAEKVALETVHKMGKTETTVRTNSTRTGIGELPSEEMAYRMVKVYFEELARTGFKRQMSLDDLVDAFIYSWYRVEKQLGRKDQCIHNEETAYRLVNLYFIELARVGHKRTLNLDELLNAYFYVLDRLGKDNTELIHRMQAAKGPITRTTTTTTTTETKKEGTPTTANPFGSV
ncbi:hypothetical protein KKE06_02150 [Candidatus Micrarchaeota archaeon]|nr:hypothetical protein [Candidatus Micrarchaeota archaeon]MBU1930228.1 hypothetical protein [Candidatus Micrarchaeota archaeon]